MKLLEYLGIFVGGPEEVEEVEERVGEHGELDLGRGLLGVKGTIDAGEGTEGLVLIMTESCAWAEGQGGRSSSSVVPGSTGGVWVPESEYCLPQGG